MNAITTPELRACNTDASLVNACELSDLYSGIRELGKHFKHTQPGIITRKVSKRLCRELGADKLENIPRNRLSEATRLIEHIRGEAIENSVSLWSLEQRFVGQLFGVGDE